MGLAYIKVEPENAIEVIDICIVDGYRLKDKMTAEYVKSKDSADSVDGLLRVWEQEAQSWAVQTIDQLSNVFVSEKELYNFRDAPVGALSRVGWNIQVDNILKLLQARIDKLNSYDENIRNNFKVNLEVVMRDKIVQIGEGVNNVETTN